MLGNSITMADAGVVTLFSMGIVFAALILISLMLDLMRIVTVRKKPEKKIEIPVIQPTVIIEEKDEKEIIAVITAAIAAHLGKRTDQLIVRSITQIRNQEPAWAQAGRMELMK